MNFTAIECSTNVCSIASYKSNKLLNVIDISDSYNHSTNLPIIFKSIDDDLKKIDTKVNYYAISIGPGSFTSLRISLSFLKGIVFSKNIPILPVQTLAALNVGTEKIGKHYIIIDSFKDRCFIQKFNNHTQIGTPYIEKILNLKNLDYPIYGYSNNIDKNNYIKPSSLLIGAYVIRNYKRLIKKPANDISPIYLSENVYKKMDDS